MTTDIREVTGPIDYLVLEFPADPAVGDGLTLLIDLIDKAVVRLLDLVFVRKERDGSLIRLAITDLDGDGNVDLAIFEGDCADLLDPNGADDVSAALPPGGAAAIVIYENRWSEELAPALRRGGAQIVASGRLRYPDIVAALNGLDVTD